MAELAIAAAVAGTGLKAAGSLMEGRERAASAEFESRELARQEQDYRTAAAQAEARRRENLTSSLETIAAIRAGRGVGSSSPTAMAIFESTIRDESRDIRTERLNYLSKAEQARLSSRMAKRKAKSSLLSGKLGAAEAIVSGGYKIATAGQV